MGVEWRGFMKVTDLEYKRVTLDETKTILEEIISKVNI